MTPSLAQYSTLTSHQPLPMSQPWLLRCMPNESVQLHLSVDPRHNCGYPINRACDLPALHANGQTLTDQRTMRQGLIMTEEQHLAELWTRYPAEAPLVAVGNGNLLANYGFVAWVAGTLYALADEPVYKRPYACIVSTKDGRVTVEDLFFAQENGGTTVLRKTKGSIQDMTSQIVLASSGQPLVRHGEVIPLEQIAEEWYDPRHLVTPLCIAINDTTLFVPQAQFQHGLLRKALCQPVHMRLEAQVDEETILPLSASGWVQMAKDTSVGRAQVTTFLKQQGLLNGEDSLDQAPALLAMVETTTQLLEDSLKAYRLVDDSRSLSEGEARFINGHLEIFFKKALYPHNCFVRWADGSCGFVIWPGKSGRAGTTLPHAQQFLTEHLKVQDAILLDNGGDVRLWYRGQHLVPSSEGREEIRSILALSVPKGAWACLQIGVS